MHSEFTKFYRSIIKEDTSIETEKAKKSNTKETKTIQNKLAEKQTPETDNGVKTLEKDFLDKFIRYNELQLLMRDLPEIANSFKTIEGFDEQLIRDTVEKLLSDRQKEIDGLTKELTELRDKITKEAEVANYKKSVIDIFNNQSTKNQETNAYGYMAKTDNGDAFNNGETIAGKNGVPTTLVGMPEVIDTKNEMMQAEELPSNNNDEQQEIEDLDQAIEKNADMVEIPEVPAQTGRITRAQLKKLQKTNLDKTGVLIDSKKKKSAKK